MITEYTWETPIGYAETEGARLNTPAGVGIVHRKGQTSAFVAKFRGNVLGRNYTSMAAAKSVVQMAAARRERRETAAEGNSPTYQEVRSNAET
jgi:hypothetical protein